MSANLNKLYHKGKFRSGEWAKHLRPYLKKVGNRRFRRTGKKSDNELFDFPIIQPKHHKRRRTINVKITTLTNGIFKTTNVHRFRTMRDVENSIRRPSVIHYKILN